MGGDDIGIVNLLAAYLVRLQQRQQVRRHLVRLISDVKQGLKRGKLVQHLLKGQRRNKRARVCHLHKVFADHLAADP